MFENHAETCIDQTRFDFQFKDFLGNLLRGKIIYCVTDPLSIVKILNICPNFQDLSSRLSAVDYLLDET